MSKNDFNKLSKNADRSSRNGEPEIPGDPPVYYTQVWLNQKYGDNLNWVTLDEDGITGWGTIYGLVRALQIYLGVTADGDFGNGTKSAFQTRFSNTNGYIVPVLNTTDNIYGIISGALWCKGYYGSFEQQIDCKIDERGSSSIIDLKRDAGLSTSNNYVDALLMKALLSMDQFVLLSNYGGISEIRTIQQYLNSNYGNFVGIVPCDGLYQREMNRALIKVLQYVEGFRGSNVDGIFGNGTKNNLPMLSNSNHPTEAMRLYNFCLTCNGHLISETNWTSDVTTKTRAFQTKCHIPVTGLGDTNTWMSLLLSKGNSERSALGCDCATILSSSKATDLYNAGYRYVGRYLSGSVGSGANATSKALTSSEISSVFAAGLRIFAIYQEGDVFLERYTYAMGLQDATNAINAAQTLGIPMREYIYFAVDYDVLDGYVSSYVVPYFQAINDVMASNGNMYLIGIYGSRNLCSRICSEFGLASSCFISDMSTGYSGNMGYQFPKCWAFDQFHEYTFTGNNNSFPLDKDAVSGQYLGFDHLLQEPEQPIFITEENKRDAAYGLMSNVVPQSILGPRASFDWELGPFEIPADPVRIRVTYKCASLFDIGSDCAQYLTYGISNGAIPTITWSAANDLYDSLDGSFKSSLDLNGINLATQLVQDVDNGKISFGTKLTSAGELSTFIIIEQYLGNTEQISNTVSVKFEFIMKNENNDQNLQSTYAESMEQVLTVVAVAVVTAVVVIGIIEVVAASSVLAAVVSFFSMVGMWLGQVFQLA